MTRSNFPQVLAVVDLGSNSFRLQVSKLIETPVGYQFRTLDSLKEPVRLASGLSSDDGLDEAAQQRAVGALLKFAERLRSFSPEAVRAVATSTYRVTKNSAQLKRRSEDALGFPIEVISGHEEARLIYAGAAHELPNDQQSRLVIDIGGGSTECIVGKGHETLALESALVGCVSLSQKYFDDTARISAKRFDEAYFKARSRLEIYTEQLNALAWKYAVGTSGTFKAISLMCEKHTGTPTITKEALENFKKQLLSAGGLQGIDVSGLNEDRRHIFAGGLAITLAVFDQFGIHEMRYCNSALRHGLMYDLVARKGEQDMREVTVQGLLKRYNIDLEYAQALSDTACGLFDQATKGIDTKLADRKKLLRWACLLADAGQTISHEDFHKHSAYILSHVDMQGFSQSQQAMLANLTLAQTGGMRKLKPLFSGYLDWLAAISLRVAFILHRRRDHQEVPLPELTYKQEVLTLRLQRSWLDAHPLTQASLEETIGRINELNVFSQAKLGVRQI